MGWVGVDLDATLAEYPADFPEIGPPIPAMVARVRQLLDAGVEVRIFTARVCPTQDMDFLEDQKNRIAAWSQTHIGRALPATATKDFMMLCLFDDRCWQVEANTGQLLSRGIELPNIDFSTLTQIDQICPTCKVALPCVEHQVEAIHWVPAYQQVIRSLPALDHTATIE
jgi:hypothetical protein